MVRPLPLCALLLLGTAARAQQIYTWKDDEGVTHFTDDISAVPSGKAFRTTAGEDISEVRMGGTAREQAEAKKLQKAQAERDAAVRERDLLLRRAQAAPAPPQEVAKVDVEQLWRTRFREANNRVHDLEAAITADSERVETVNGMPVNFNSGCLYGWGAPGAVLPVGSTTQQSTTAGVGLNVPLPGGGAFAGGTVLGATTTTRTVGAGFHGGFPVGCSFLSPEFERVRERLAANRRELVRAKEDLLELERRASFEAVPREWRR